MATPPEQLDELTRMLAALSPEDRAKVIEGAAGHHVPPSQTGHSGKAFAADFRPPLIRGGVWTGGSLRREELYGDEDR